MHPNRAFDIRDTATMRSVVNERMFGMMVASTREGLRVAQVPVLLDGEDRLHFHLARNNPVGQLADGSEVLFLCNGPDGYISPDWYGLPDQVPTWNYVSIELAGTIHRLPDAELPGIVERLSSAQEQRLHPKPEWHHRKMDQALFARMLKGIAAYAMIISEWRGTAKLGQNKSPVVRIRAAAGVREQGNPALADLMVGGLA